MGTGHRDRENQRDRQTDRRNVTWAQVTETDRENPNSIIYFFKGKIESHTKSRTRSNDPHLQSIGQLERPAPVQLADVDVAEPALGEPLLAAGVGDEVLVAPELCKLHHRAVTEVLQRFAQRREGVHAGFLVAQT